MIDQCGYQHIFDRLQKPSDQGCFAIASASILLNDITILASSCMTALDVQSLPPASEYGNNREKGKLQPHATKLVEQWLRDCRAKLQSMLAQACNQPPPCSQPTY